MEFFRKISLPDMDTDNLKQLLTISTMPDFCDSIETVLSDQDQEGEIYCLWGQFDIRRDLLKHGVRFSLLNCPHALAWTITYNETERHIAIHCTIDKTEQDNDFVDSIQQFVTDWERGISTQLQLKGIGTP